MKKHRFTLQERDAIHACSKLEGVEVLRKPRKRGERREIREALLKELNSNNNQDEL